MTKLEPIQLIFVVETTEKVKSDEIYINEVLRHYYIVGENKISFVYLEGKYKYNKARVIKKINTLQKEFLDVGSGKSYVIYVFDKDQAHIDRQDVDFVHNVTNYCQQHGYELIWFVKTIEEVMTGSKVRKSEKKNIAVNFLRKRSITKINTINLSAAHNVNKNGKSNIISVLNKFPEIKR